MRYFEWALADGAGDPIAVRIGLGQSQVLAGEVNAGREGLRQVAAAANAAGRPADAVRAVLAMGSGVGGFEVDIGDTSQEHLLTSALAALPEDDHVTRAAGLARLSVVWTLLAIPEERATKAREALTLAAASGDPTVEAAALAALNDAIAGPDHVADRLHGRGPDHRDRRSRVGHPARAAGAPAAAGGQARVRGPHRSGPRHRRVRRPRATPPTPHLLLAGAAVAGHAGRHGRRLRHRPQLRGRGRPARPRGWERERRDDGVDVRLQHAKTTGSAIAFAALLADIARWSVEPSQWDRCFAAIYAHSGVFDKARYHMDRITTAGLDTIPKDSEWVELMRQLAEAALLLADRKVAEEIRGRLAPYADLWAVDGIGGACFGRVADMVARLDELLGRPEPGAAPQQPESTESAELRREGRVWQVAFRGGRPPSPTRKGWPTSRHSWRGPDDRFTCSTSSRPAADRPGQRPAGVPVRSWTIRRARRTRRGSSTSKRRSTRPPPTPTPAEWTPSSRSATSCWLSWRCPRAVRSRSSYRRPGRACPQGGHDAHRHRPEGDRGSPSRARAAPATVGVHRTLLLLPARAAGHVANLMSRRDDATPDVTPPW